MRAYILCVCILLPLLLMQCKPKSSIVKTEENSNPAVFQPEQIDLDEVKVVGQLIKENNVDFFMVDKILLRGRSAPVINSGQKVKVGTNLLNSSKYNKELTVLLKCRQIPENDDCLWTIKPINN